jgi:undecaprenyl pyrophosphate phosphatase UppP
MALVRMAPWILITFLVGYLSLIIVKKFNKKRWLTLFGIYRIILGLLILLLAI